MNPNPKSTSVDFSYLLSKCGYSNTCAIGCRIEKIKEGVPEASNTRMKRCRSSTLEKVSLCRSDFKHPQEVLELFVLLLYTSSLSWWHRFGARRNSGLRDLFSGKWGWCED